MIRHLWVQLRLPMWVIALCGAMTGGGLAPSAGADEIKKAAQDPEAADDRFFRFWLNAGSMAQKPEPAMLLLTARDRISLAHLLWAEWKVYGQWRIAEPDFAAQIAELRELRLSRTLNPNLVKALAAMDKKPVPQLDERPATPRERAFLELFTEAVYYAQHTPVEAFEASAREMAKPLTSVTWGHLYNNPKAHWGKEVTLSGDLLRIREQVPPAKAQEKGVKILYEGWVQTTTDKATPVTVIFSHLPPGMKVAEKVLPPQKVTFHGYFLGRTAYRGEDLKDHYTLLIVAPTLVKGQVEAKPADSPWSPFAYIVLFGILGIASVVIFLAVGLNVWYRKGDKRVRDRLAQIHAERAVRELELAENPSPETPEKTEGNGFFKDQSKQGMPPT